MNEPAILILIYLIYYQQQKNNKYSPLRRGKLRFLVLFQQLLQLLNIKFSSIIFY